MTIHRAAKQFQSVLSLVLATLLLLTLAGCESPTVSASRTEGEEATSESKSLITSLFESVNPPTYELEEGTPLQVRLSHTVGTASHQPGDTFEGLVDTPVYFDGRLLVPEGAKVEGRLTDLKEPGRVKGVAELRMNLESLTIDGETYDVRVHPLTFRASKTTKKDAAVIAGSSAVGAVIGALTGGGKGAAVGAGVGGGAGTGYVLLTEGDEVRLTPERKIRFTLSRPLQLPEQPEPAG